MHWDAPNATVDGRRLYLRLAASRRQRIARRCRRCVVGFFALLAFLVKPLTSAAERKSIPITPSGTSGPGGRRESPHPAGTDEDRSAAGLHAAQTLTR